MGTGTTRRVHDDGEVPFDVAVAAWAEAAYPVLRRAAGTYGAFLTYQQLAESVQEDTGIVTGVPFRHWIGRVLGAVSREQMSRPDEPFVTSLVVRADGTIGEGYAMPVVERDGAAPADLELEAAAERLRCYEYFGAVLPPDGGRPQLTPGVVARRSSARARKSVQQPVVVCPTCNLTIPRSGICDTCG